MIEDDTLYIVMPAYNEEGSIEDVIKSWYPLLDLAGEQSRVVVADSGSSDHTHAIIEHLRGGGEYPKLEVLSGTDRYHGPKLIALYDYAIKHGADYIFQTDSDGQTNPGEFQSFWDLRRQYDGIFGHRSIRGDGKDRAFVEKVVCLLLRVFFGVSVPDANAPFRLMRADAVGRHLGRMPGDYNLPNIMLTTFFVRFGERVAFREISFQPRQAGVNSVNISRIVRIGIKALGDFMAFRKAMNKS